MTRHARNRRHPPGPPGLHLSAGFAALALVVAGCSDSPTSPILPEEAFTWETVSAASAGLDPDVVSAIESLAATGGSECLLVTRDGRIVHERFWNGTGPQTEFEVWSVTKSITATLVGIAQDQGHLDIDQPASDFIIEWVDTDSEGVTIRNLLSNDSGRFQTFESDYIELASNQPDKSAYAIGLSQQHPIGQEWVYNNAAIQVLEEVLQRAVGMDVGEFARVYLFEPLGMTSEMTEDEAGNTLTFMGAQMSCRDMARFGLLYLWGGEWEGEQIVPAGFVAEATRPSQSLNPGYGFLWWLYPGGYAAQGLGGQVILVSPDEDVVVTRIGDPSVPFDQATVMSLVWNELVMD